MINLKANSASQRLKMRSREIDTVFKSVPKDCFEDALELGAGDGAQSKLIARYCQQLLSTDLNADRLEQDTYPKVTYKICDAMDIPFESARFDLIYSSNLFEHVPDPKRALYEMKRVLRDDGVMAHIIPNRFWKFLHLAMFLPNELVIALEIALTAGKSRRSSNRSFRGNNLQRETPSFLRRHIWPTVHGEYKNHMEEFIRMGSGYWQKIFTESGFEVVGTITGLPVHSPYRFGFETLRRLLEDRGLSSCNGYVLKKAESESLKSSLIVSSPKQ